MGYKSNLNDRLFKFAVGVIKFLFGIENIPETRILKNQLTKSSTSSGANYEEAQAASSNQDFLNKIRISLREMRESNYWLRILNDLKLGNFEKIELLNKESEELKNMLGSIAAKMDKRLKSK